MRKLTSLSLRLKIERFAKALPLNATNKRMAYIASKVQKTMNGSYILRELSVVADKIFCNISMLEYLRSVSIGGYGTFRASAKSQPNEIQAEIGKKNPKKIKLGG